VVKMPSTINGSDIDKEKIPSCCYVEANNVKCGNRGKCSVNFCYFRDIKKEENGSR